MCAKAAKYPGVDGNSEKGRAVFDILNCKSLKLSLHVICPRAETCPLGLNFFAFDVIGDLYVFRISLRDEKGSSLSFTEPLGNLSA